MRGRRVGEWEKGKEVVDGGRKEAVVDGGDKGRSVKKESPRFVLPSRAPAKRKPAKHGGGQWCEQVRIVGSGLVRGSQVKNSDETVVI